MTGLMGHYRKIDFFSRPAEFTELAGLAVEYPVISPRLKSPDLLCGCEDEHTREIFAPAVIADRKRFPRGGRELLGGNQDGSFPRRGIVLNDVFGTRRGHGVFKSGVGITAPDPARRSERFGGKIRRFEDAAKPLVQFFGANKVAGSDNAERDGQANGREA